MREFIILIAVICIMAASCTKSPVSNIEVSSPTKTQKYIGRLKGNVSLYRALDDKIIVQKEQEKSFDIHSIDINSGILDYEYTIDSQDKLLYSKQLDGQRTLKVKQLGNGEENNVLILEGKTTKSIANKIAYSTFALVSTTASKRYIIYCAVDDILNYYGLYLYDLETEKTLQLVDAVNEDLINNMEENISWSPDEAYVVVSNKLVFNASSGKLACEINAENILWSDKGRKLAYIKPDKGYGKSICILDIGTMEIEEVFLVNSEEYLPGYLVWSSNEKKLGFVTAAVNSKEMQYDITPHISAYKSIYSLDLTTKEAIRIDTLLQVDTSVVENLQSLHYNSTGDIIAFSSENYFGADLYVYNINRGISEFFMDIEYLHHENNEAYLCSSPSGIYLVQGQVVIELNEEMNSRVIYRSNKAMEDIYIAKDGCTMIIIEKEMDGIVFRQLVNFAEQSM